MLYLAAIFAIESAAKYISSLTLEEMPRWSIRRSSMKSYARFSSSLVYGSCIALCGFFYGLLHIGQDVLLLLLLELSDNSVVFLCSRIHSYLFGGSFL